MDNNKIAVAVFDKHAQAYQEKFMDVSLYADELDDFCRYVSKSGAEILELACGPGNVTRYLLGKRKDFKILGTDLSQNMIHLASLNNPDARFQLLDCRQGNSLGGTFDAIVCSFCLPYLTNEECLKLIKDASALLKLGGHFYLSTMEGGDLASGFKKGSGGEEIFMRYYQPDFLATALEESNFKVLNLYRKNYPESDGSVTIDLVIISQKQD